MAEEKKQLANAWLYSKFERDLYENTSKVNDVLEILKRLEIMVADKSRDLVTLNHGINGKKGWSISVPDCPGADAKLANALELAKKYDSLLLAAYPSDQADDVEDKQQNAEKYFKMRNKFKKNKGIREQSR